MTHHFDGTIVLRMIPQALLHFFDGGPQKFKCPHHKSIDDVSVEGTLL